MLKQRHQFFVALLCAADALMVVAATVGAWALRRQALEQGFPEWSTEATRYFREPLTFVVLPISLIVFWGFGLYRPFRDRTVRSELAQVFKASVTIIIGAIVSIFILGPVEVGGWTSVRGAVMGVAMDAGRVQMVALACLLPVFVGFERAVFRAVLRWFRRHGKNLRHVAVIGTGRLGRIVCRTLDRNSWTGIHVAYFISHQEQASGPAECVGRPVVGGLADLEKILELRRPDAVYLALPTSRALVRPTLLRRLERFVVDVRVIPDVNPRYLGHNMVLSELEGMPILSVRESPLNGMGGAAKRALDVMGSLAGLAFFSPLMLLIALAVRISSPGPVIFRQRRVSLGGEEFNILKFRTMYYAEDESAPAAWTSRDDKRVTPIGKLLRRCSLDELPQLYNVLRGDMSLVGPRPERPELIARFREDWRGYMLRQHVKAGITGWAQVNGLRGDTSLRKRIQLDLFYIRHWSLGFDLKILWLTLFRGFVHRNAH